MLERLRFSGLAKAMMFSMAIFLLLILQGCSVGDQLKTLVEKEQFEEAANLFAENKEFFKQHKDKSAEHLTLVAENLNKSFEPGLQSSINKVQEMIWPASESKWDEIKKQIMEVSNLLSEYDSYDILKEENFTLPIRNRLWNVFDEKIVNIKQRAETAFLNYNHFGGNTFFEVYPVQLEQRDFMSAHFEHIYTFLSSLTSLEIEKFARLYQAENTFSKVRFEAVSNLYLSASLKEKVEGNHPDFKTIIDSIQTAQKYGFTPSEVAGVKIGFLLLTSQKLHDNELIEFPIELKRDLPFEYLEVDANNIQLDQVASGFDYLVVLQALEGAINREATNRKKISSKFQSGAVSVRNPEYDKQLIIVNELQNRARQAQYEANYSQQQAQNNTTGSGNRLRGSRIVEANAAIAKLAAQNMRNKVNNAISRLNQIPTSIEQPVYQNYEFNSVDIKAKRTLNLKYYVLKYNENNFSSNDASFVQENNFTILYGLHDKDLKRWTYLSDTDSEDDLEKWGEEPFIVKMSSVSRHSKMNSSEVGKPISHEIIETELFNSVASIIQRKMDSSPTLFDQRFESVVVVLNSEGTLGSGFFVEPDIVLTNLHVVGGTKYVEMKTYGGNETFGKVVASNIRLDLALIKVQTRGKPVHFYDGVKTNLGDTIEAIGHPSGLEFSITRGVVSAIRECPSLYAPDADSVLVVQTDTAINPGNSGGPLFLGDKVIGVNSQKLVNTDIEGLGFAIHYSEIVKFINKNKNNQN